MTPKTKQLILKAMKYCSDSDRKDYILKYIKHDEAREAKNDSLKTFTPPAKVQYNSNR
jgi:hypothetical protein